MKTRSSSLAITANTFTDYVHEYIQSLQIPRSTLEEFDYLFQLPTSGKETVYDPFRALFRAIHDDTLSLVGVIHVSLRRIREGTLDENLMQRSVNGWRGLLHKLNFSLAELDQRLREFVHFAYESDMHPLSFDPRGEPPSQRLAKDTRQTLKNCMDLIDKTSDSLRAEMQIVDSRRSIAEAESVSKLTELAFVFIPLSCVASIFSMQVHELDGGVPLYQAVLVAMAFIIVAYAIRLSIRSSSLIDTKEYIMNQIREEARLEPSEQIPTRAFVAYISGATKRTLLQITKNFILVFAPLVFGFAVVAAVLSPIVLLWLRDINNGFTAVITVLLLLLDAVLFYPFMGILVDASGSVRFDPVSFFQEMRKQREVKQRNREKSKKLRRGKGLEDEDEEDEHSVYSAESSEP